MNFSLVFSKSMNFSPSSKKKKQMDPTLYQTFKILSSHRQRIRDQFAVTVAQKRQSNLLLMLVGRVFIKLSLFGRNGKLHLCIFFLGQSRKIPGLRDEYQP